MVNDNNPELIKDEAFFSTPSSDGSGLMLN